MAGARTLENIGEVSALENIGEDIFEEGLKYLKKTVKFAVVILISCNGAKSIPFSKAECEFRFFKHQKKTLGIPFADVFKNGMAFLEEMDKVKKGKIKIGTLDEPVQKALSCLADYFKTKGKGI